MGMLEQARRLALGDGRALRLLSAMEVLEARREAESLAGAAREQSLCANACLLARALERKKKPAFKDGEAVLREMTTAEIGRLAKAWAQFDREVNPSALDSEERIDALKKALSTRLMSAFGGACSRLLEHCQLRRGPGE